jgi:hypothetical protein
MTGYVRTDTTNNIADGNIINATDLDNEFDGVQAAFNSSTGHNHDGTTGEGAPILVLGPTQDVVVGAAAVTPKTTNTVDLGSGSLKFKDLFLAGNGSIGGTVAVTGVATLTAQPVLSSLTASSAVATDASKGLVSVTNTGTGNNVLATSPTLVTPALGTPSSVTLTNGTGLPISTGVSGLGTGVATALAVNVGTAGSPVVNGGVLGTPSSGTLTNATGLPVATGISGLGSGVATFLATPSSANLASAVTDETGTGALVFANSPTFVTPALGTPASGVVTNLTGTASININGTVGATTANTGAFTDLSASGAVTLSGATANGVVYANGSKVLTTGSALTFDGSSLVGTGKFQSQVVRIKDAAYSELYFSTGDTAGAGAFSYEHSTNSLGFYANSAEQMRLTSTGLGIGTSSPSHKLVVQQSDTTAYAASSASLVEPAGGTNTQILNVGSGGFASLRFAALSGSYSQGYLGFTNTTGVGGAFVFGQRTGGSSYAEQMRLDSSGNLGLGVTPSAWSVGKAIELGSVNGNALWGIGANACTLLSNAYFNSGYVYANNGFANRYDNGGAAGVHAWHVAPSGTAGDAISFTQAMTLDADGDLGIGTTSPTKKLHIAATNGNSAILLGRTNAGAASLGQIGFATVNGTVAGIDATSITDSSNGALRFFTTGGSPQSDVTSLSERARIDFGGNLLVGLTSATGVAKLQVSGPIQTTGYTVATLPAGTVGMRTYVTDALAPLFGVAVAGSGAVTIPVFYDGANWIVA